MDPRKFGEYVYDDIVLEYEPFYIGKGKGKRIDSHLTSYELTNQKRIKCNTLKNLKIKSIMSDNLIPLRIKLFENLTNDDASLYERNIILKIGKIISKTGPLCNITDGGDGGDNMKFLNPDKKKEIYDRLSKLFKGQPYKGPEKGQIIYQYDLDGNYITEWRSISKASRELGIHKHMIIQNLKNNQYKSAGGFMFSTNKRDKIEPIKKNLVEVIQYDMDGNFIKKWDSMKEASDTLNINISGISLTCSGKYKYSGGFKWTYNN